MSSPARIVVDVQRGVDDPVWGRRNNPGCEGNVARLVARAGLAGPRVQRT